MIRRILAVIVIVILGSIAARELLDTINHLMPILIIITVVGLIGGGLINRKRKF